MYTLHIGNKNYSSWSLRPWVLMTELGVAFTEKLSPFETGSSWEKFRSFSPTGLVPCLVEHSNDAQEDIVVWDSLAIMEYLAEQNPTIWPESTKARAWARSAAAEMHSGFTTLRNLCPMNCALRIELYNKTQGLEQDLKRIEELLLEGLNQFDGPYLAGEKYSAVDAFYAPVIFRFRTYGFTFSDKIMEYLRLILELNSMQQWDKEAIAEEWIEEAHEEEAKESGVIIKDFRL